MSSRRRDFGLLEATGVAVVLLALVLVAPGALLVFLGDRALGARMDTGQMWTFSLAASGAMATAAVRLSRSLRRGLARYLVAAASVSGLVLLCRFGFKAQWCCQLIEAFRP